MKKEFIFGLIFILLFVNFVAAANITKMNFTDSSNVKEKTNEVLTKQVEIPDNLKLVTRVLFGLKADDKVDLQTFVLLIAFFVFVFLLLHSAISLIWGDWKSWLATLIVSLLIGLTGTIRESVSFFFGIGNLFGFLEQHGLIRLVIVLIILLIIFFFLSEFFNKLRRNVELEESTQVGQDVRFMTAISRVFRNIWGKDK